MMRKFPDRNELRTFFEREKRNGEDCSDATQIANLLLRGIIENDNNESRQYGGRFKSTSRHKC